MRESINPNIKAVLCAASVASLLALSSAGAIDVIKENNATVLNDGGSWVLGSIPGAGDIAVWDDTITANRSQVIGGDLSWQGIRIANPGGTATLMTIGNTAGSTLSLGTSGINMSAATVDLTINASLNISGSQTWSVASGRVLSLGNIANTATPGTVITLSGPGTLSLGNNSSLGGAGAYAGLIIEGTPTLTGGSSRVISNDITLNSDVYVRPATSTSNIQFTTGDIDVGNATRRLIVDRADANPPSYSLLLNGANDGTTQYIGAGTLAIESANPLSNQIVVRIGGGGSLHPVINTGFSVGNGVFLFIAGGSPFTTETRLNVDTTGVYGMSSLGSGGTGSISQTIQSLSGAGSIINNTTGTGTATLTIDGTSYTSSTDFSGSISGGATGRIGITKAGTTTQSFSGANTYIGQTQVNGGALLVNGTHIAAAADAAGFGSAANGRYRVAAGAVLGGDGRINIALATNTNANNAILVQSGGIVAPGSMLSSIDTLTLDAAGFTRTDGNDIYLNMAAGSKFAFQLAGDGSSADRIDFWNYVNGDFLLNTNQIDLTLSGPLVAGSHTVDIFRFYSDGGANSAISGIESGLVLGTLGAGIDDADIIYNSASGLIQIQYSVIPEPTTALLLAVGGLVTMVFRRRRSA